MKTSNSSLNIIMAILVIVLIFGVIALVILVFNYSKDGAGGTQPQGAPAAESQIPPELFPANSQIEDPSKVTISGIRQNPDASFTKALLIIPQSLGGFSAEVNEIQFVLNPIGAGAIRIGLPTGLNVNPLEIPFKAGAETLSSCIV